jgi:hypothetical protein
MPSVLMFVSEQWVALRRMTLQRHFDLCRIEWKYTERHHTVTVSFCSVSLYWVTYTDCHFALFCCTEWHYKVSFCYVPLYWVTQNNTQCHFALWHCIEWHYTEWHFALCHRIEWHYTEWHFALYWVTWHKHRMFA